MADTTELGLDPELQEMLRCPRPHHATLVADVEHQELVCSECGTAFPVRDGIPVMLLDEARPGPVV